MVAFILWDPSCGLFMVPELNEFFYPCSLLVMMMQLRLNQLGFRSQFPFLVGHLFSVSATVFEVVVFLCSLTPLSTPREGNSPASGANGLFAPSLRCPSSVHGRHTGVCCRRAVGVRFCSGYHRGDGPQLCGDHEYADGCLSNGCPAACDCDAKLLLFPSTPGKHEPDVVLLVSLCLRWVPLDGT